MQHDLTRSDSGDLLDSEGNLIPEYTLSAQSPVVYETVNGIEVKEGVLLDSIDLCGIARTKC